MVKRPPETDAEDEADSDRGSATERCLKRLIRLRISRYFMIFQGFQGLLGALGALGAFESQAESARIRVTVAQRRTCARVSEGCSARWGRGRCRKDGLLRCRACRAGQRRLEKVVGTRGLDLQAHFRKRRYTAAVQVWEA